MTPQEVIAEARSILNDTDAASYRYSDSDLLTYFNDAIKTATTLRPELFSTVATFACVPGQCEQTLTYANAVALLDVICHSNGTAIRLVDIDTMNAFHPGWRTDPAAPAVNWMPVKNDPLRFYIYPKAPASQNLDVRYVTQPSVYALNDNVTGVSDTLKPAFVDYIVAMAESRDDEHVVSQRAAQFMAQFTARLKG